MELLIAHRASVVKLRLLQLNIVGGQGESLQMNMVIFEEFIHRLGSLTKDNTFYCRAFWDPRHLPSCASKTFNWYLWWDRWAHSMVGMVNGQMTLPPLHHDFTRASCFQF